MSTDQATAVFWWLVIGWSLGSAIVVVPMLLAMVQYGVFRRKKRP